MKQKSAVEWLVEQIENQQKFYIDLAKKDKTKRKEVDAILTATTLFKMKCGKAKEMENQKQQKYKEMLEMLKSIISDFEGDYVVDEVIVDQPYKWLIDRYKEAKQLIKEATEL
jgi:hypothetical protein